MNGHDFTEILVPAVNRFILGVETYISGLAKPALKQFMSSLLDREKEHLKDIEECCMSLDFPALSQDEDIRYCRRLLSAITDHPLDVRDSLTLMKDITERKQAAHDLFVFLAAQSADEPVAGSLANLAQEEKRHIELIRDRITLEEFGAGS
ncbi:MAG: hypothetical protein JXB03_03490 [Spirochaetales bacterium]|nr:hypothetical protein [Spirochaetales bacterium]